MGLLELVHISGFEALEGRITNLLGQCGCFAIL